MEQSNLTIMDDSSLPSTNTSTNTPTGLLKVKYILSKSPKILILLVTLLTVVIILTGIFIFTQADKNELSQESFSNLPISISSPNEVISYTQPMSYPQPDSYISSQNTNTTNATQTPENISYPIIDQTLITDMEIYKTNSLPALYFTHNNATYKLDSSDSKPRKIAEAGGVLSPDKKFLVYTKKVDTVPTDGYIYKLDISSNIESKFTEVFGSPVSFSPGGKYLAVYGTTSAIGGISVYDFESGVLLLREQVVKGKFTWASSTELLYVEAIVNLVGRPYDTGAHAGGVTKYDFSNKEKKRLVLPSETKEYGYVKGRVFDFYNSPDLLHLVEEELFIDESKTDYLTYSKVIERNRILNIRTGELLDELQDIFAKELAEKVSELHGEYTAKNFQISSENPSLAVFQAMHKSQYSQPVYSYLVDLSDENLTLTPINLKVDYERVVSEISF